MINYQELMKNCHGVFLCNSKILDKYSSNSYSLNIPQNNISDCSILFHNSKSILMLQRKVFDIMKRILVILPILVMQHFWTKVIHKWLFFRDINYKKIFFSCFSCCFIKIFLSQILHKPKIKGKIRQKMNKV